MTMLPICAIQDGSHQSHAATEHLKDASVTEPNLKFYIILFNLNLNSQMWLVATILDSRGPVSLLFTIRRKLYLKHDEQVYFSERVCTHTHTHTCTHAHTQLQWSTRCPDIRVSLILEDMQIWITANATSSPPPTIFKRLHYDQFDGKWTPGKEFFNMLN